MVLSRIRDFFERKEKRENIPPAPKLEKDILLPVKAYQENPYRSLAPISVPAQPMYDFLEGKDFYDDSMPKALRKALKYAGPNGIVLTAPEMIAAKAQAGKDHRFNSQLYSVHSEEDLGIDHDGVFLGRGEGIYVIVHGGGLLTPDRIDLAIREGLIYGAAKYTPDEFTGLLHGALPDGTRIPLYALDDIGKSIFNLPHQFGIVAPYRMMRETLSGRHTKEEFLSSPLVKARNAGTKNLEAYFEKQKETVDEENSVDNLHILSALNPEVPQGRPLVFGNYDVGGDGLYDDDVNNDGLFVGVRERSEP